jgi:hypothetical protein
MMPEIGRSNRETKDPEMHPQGNCHIDACNMSKIWIELRWDWIRERRLVGSPERFSRDPLREPSSDDVGVLYSIALYQCHEIG